MAQLKNLIVNGNTRLLNTLYCDTIIGNASTATTASKLSTNAGSSTQPVYFSGGVPVACTAYSSASVNYANSAGSATTSTYITTQSQLTTVDAVNSFHDANGVKYATWNSTDIASMLGGGIGGNGVILSLPWTNANYGVQLFLDDDPNPYFKFRQRTNGTWSTVYDVLTSGNYTSWAPSLTGSGASGTWGISISGNADTVDGHHINTDTWTFTLSDSSTVTRTVHID